MTNLSDKDRLLYKTDISLAKQVDLFDKHGPVARQYKVVRHGSVGR
jgi:hypothetical protein